MVANGEFESMGSKPPITVRRAHLCILVAGADAWKRDPMNPLER